MTDDDALLLETYARRPDALTVDENVRVDALLQSEPDARAWLDQMRAYYEALDTPMSGDDERKRDERVSQFVDGLFVPRPVVYVRRPPQLLRPTVVAADTAARRRFQATSLVNRKHQVLLRILNDRDASVHRLYLLAEDTTRFNRVAVQVEGHDPVVLDQNGWARLSPGTTEPTKQREASIHRPVWRQPIRRLPVDQPERRTASTGHRLIIRRTRERVHIQETLRSADCSPLFGAALLPRAEASAATSLTGAQTGDDVSTRLAHRFCDGCVHVPIPSEMDGGADLFVYG